MVNLVKRIFVGVSALVFAWPLFAGAGGTTLNPGEALTAGQYLESGNHLYRAYLEGDGNLAVYGASRLWATNAQGNTPSVRLILQGDGNLVIYNDSALSGVSWASGTNGHPGARLILQTDGNLVLYDGNTAVWASWTQNTPGGNFQPNTSRNHVSILDFGAISSTSQVFAPLNRKAIQAAIDSIPSNTSAVVQVPAGVYYIDGPIRLRSGVSIVGEARDVSVIRCAGTQNVEYNAFYLGTVASGFGQNGGYLNIRDLSILGVWDGTTQGSGVGINVIDGWGIKISNVLVTAFDGVGIHFKGIGYSSIDHSQVAACGQDCIWLESVDANSNQATSTSINECQLNSGRRSSVHITTGLSILVNACQIEDSGIAGSNFTHVYVANAGGIVVDGTGNRAITISNNYFERVYSPFYIAAGLGDFIGMVVSNNFFAPANPSVNPNLFKDIQLPSLGAYVNFAYLGNVSMGTDQWF